jgi:hypothetical protein
MHLSEKLLNSINKLIDSNETKTIPICKNISAAKRKKTKNVGIVIQINWQNKNYSRSYSLNKYPIEIAVESAIKALH